MPSGTAPLFFLEDAPHIARTLRHSIGDEISAVDGQGHALVCRLTAVSPKRVEAQVLSCREAGTEPAIRITVYQAICKNQKMESVVQKCSELGAVSIVPVQTQHSEIPAKDYQKRQPRLQRIAREAIKQCGRSFVPQVGDACRLLDCDLSAYDLTLCAYETAPRTSLKRALSYCGAPQSLAIVIGPEGGFASYEIEALCQRGVVPVSLGPRILRTETASPALLAAVLYHYGQWED